jgi:hypothetical protein
LRWRSAGIGNRKSFPLQVHSATPDAGPGNGLVCIVVDIMPSEASGCAVSTSSWEVWPDRISFDGILLHRRRLTEEWLKKVFSEACSLLSTASSHLVVLLANLHDSIDNAYSEKEYPAGTWRTSHIVFFTEVSAVFVYKTHILIS